MAIDYYELLGVRSTATINEIRAAYRARIREYHPDRNASVHATAVAALINEAWEVLSDPARRQEYDTAARSAAAPADAAADPTESESSPPAVTWRGRVAGAVLILIGIGAALAGDRPGTAYNGALVALFWLCLVVGIACMARPSRRLRAVLLSALALASPVGFLVWWRRERAAQRKNRDSESASASEAWVCPRCARRVPRRVQLCRCGFVRSDVRPNVLSDEADMLLRLARWLFGYRDDLDLPACWWHRLFKFTMSRRTLKKNTAVRSSPSARTATVSRTSARECIGSCVASYLRRLTRQMSRAGLVAELD